MKNNLKKFIITIVILALCAISVSPIFAVQVKRYYGDVNNDGYITIDDAVLALRAAVGISGNALYGMDFKCADIDKDNKISTYDAREILKMAAGIAATELMEDYEFELNSTAFNGLINDYRKASGQNLADFKLSPELCTAAAAAAEEFGTKTGNAFLRDNKTLYYTILDEYKIQYLGADKIVCVSSSDYREAVKVMTETLQSEKSLLSTNVDTLGVGAYSPDGRTFYWCVLLIRTKL